MTIHGGTQIAKLFLRLQDYYRNEIPKDPREQARNQFVKSGRAVIKEI